MGGVCVCACVCAAPGVAAAAIYSYVDWMTADVAHGIAAGVITLPDQSTVKVTFAAQAVTGAPGTLFGAQVVGQGINYWVPATPYISAEVENAPPSTDILQLAGGKGDTYTVTLSEPIKDPIMALVSLGQPGVTITYNFDSPFTIVSQGKGYWGGSPTSLVELPNNVLQGAEGSGTIQFIGTFSTFSWTVPVPESWHGFTFGIRTTLRIEPTPDGGVGGAGGGGGEGGGGFGGGGGGNAGSGGNSGNGGASRGGAGGGSGGGGGRGGATAAGGAAGSTSRGGAGGGGGARGAAGAGGAGGRGEPAIAGVVGGARGAMATGGAGGRVAGNGGGEADGGIAGRPASSGDGCGCALGGASEETAGGLLLAALAVGSLRPRRRRRDAPSR